MYYFRHIIGRVVFLLLNCIIQFFIINLNFSSISVLCQLLNVHSIVLLLITST